MPNTRILPKSCDSSWRILVRPEKLISCKAEIGGWLRTWSEYVPSGYDGSRPVPLVLTVHGAAHHFAEENTSWAMVAEREGFIVVYPHCLREGIMFNLWRDYDEDGDMPDDIQYFDELLRIVQKKYRIDPTRIYIQGQSNGDMMTSTYLFERANCFAAAAPLSGPAGAFRFVDPVTGEIIRAPGHALPIIRTHGSEDMGGPNGKRGGKSCFIKPVPPGKPVITDEMRERKLKAHLLIHLMLWYRANGCRGLPRLSMNGRYSWLTFSSENGCDLVFYIVEQGQHGPYLDMADNIWTYFFSRYRRIGGRICRVENAPAPEEDQGAIALADGAMFAYVDNHQLPLEQPVHVIDDIFYTPISFLNILGAEIIPEDGGESAILHWQGHTLQLAKGNRVFLLDRKLRDMERVLYMHDILYVPIVDLCRIVLDFQAATGHGACYLCRRGGKMSFDLAFLIRVLVGAEPQPTPLDCYKAELPLIRIRDEEADQIAFEALLAQYREENGL